MYYFYLNFPNYKSKSIKIHHSTCGDCKSGQGKISISNEKGFWAGPFSKIEDIENSLKELQKIVKSQFMFEKCKRCLKAE